MSQELLVCKFGRHFDAQHSTCISCRRQKIVRCGTKQGKVSQPDISFKGQILTTSAYLYSANHSHGRPRYIYLAEKRKWRGVLAGTWALWGKQAGQKRLLLVRRFVAHAHLLIADRDNLEAAIKPLKDVLVEQGVLSNDKDSFVEYKITQAVDALRPRIEIEIQELESMILEAA